MEDPHQRPKLGASSSKRKVIGHRQKTTADRTDGTGSRWDKKYTAAVKGCLHIGN